MNHLADILTEGIVKQFPEKFQVSAIDAAKQISFL